MRFLFKAKFLHEEMLQINVIDIKNDKYHYVNCVWPKDKRHQEDSLMASLDLLMKFAHDESKENKNNELKVKK